MRFLIFTFTTLCVYGQTGTVDGVPLPAKAFETCTLLRNYVNDAPRVAAVREFGITVSPKEEEQARATWEARMAAAMAQMPGGREGALKAAKETGNEKVYDGYLHPSSPAHFDAKFFVEREKLDAEVDRRLGANDPQYARYLANYKAVERFDGKPFYPNRDEKAYLDQKRAQFWDARKPKNIVLSDPSLKSKCGLP